ncbi:arginine and glutamate-rich protein 1-B [Procambarus clarkii]|uniref:arginine and glutamate-rich protein 1-B n=1 Tax=Procambarus clarkii TaxID=6728 RepID=UPI00374249CE
MAVSKTTLWAGILTLAVIICILVDNILLKRSIYHQQEDQRMRINKRAVNMSACREMIQKERQVKGVLKNRILNTERNKGGLYLELERQKSALSRVQNSAAIKEEKMKEVEALTKTKGDLKKQLDEALKRATEADKAKADLQAKLTEALAKQKEAETAAAAAKNEAAKSKENKN